LCNSIDGYAKVIFKPTLIYLKNCQTLLEQDKDATIEIESQKREGYIHKVVKDLESGKAVSCSCKCWSKGNKPCAAMRSIGFDN